jgi:hypothetical protein
LRLRVRGSPAGASTRPDLVRDVSSTQGPKSAASLGYSDTELEGQYRIPDGQQCMKFADVRELLVVDVVVARDASSSRASNHLVARLGRPRLQGPGHEDRHAYASIVLLVTNLVLVVWVAAMRVGGWTPGGRGECPSARGARFPGARRQMTPWCCRYRKAAIPGSTGSQ